MDNCYSRFHTQPTHATIEFKDCNDENIEIGKSHPSESTNDGISRPCHCSKSMLPRPDNGSTRGSSPKPEEPVSVKSECQIVGQQQYDTPYQMDQENGQMRLPRTPRDVTDQKSNMVVIKGRRDGDTCEKRADCHCSLRSQSGIPLMTGMNQGPRDSSNHSNNCSFSPPGSPSHSTFDSTNSMSPTSDPNNESMRTIYPMMTMSNNLNERFLIPAHISAGEESKAALMNSRPSPPSPAGTQYPSVVPKASTAAANRTSQDPCGTSQFTGNHSCCHEDGQCSSQSTPTTNAPGGSNPSKVGSSLLCNAEGQLVVPAAFGELHGYKIQNTSNGNGLLLSVSNTNASNTSNVQATSTVAKHLIQRQPSFALGSPTSPHDAARKRELRLQKNREAARECRRKKKEYIKCLENRVAVLESENKTLHDDLRHFRELYCQSAGASGVHKTQHVHRLSPAVSTNLTSRPGSALPPSSSGCHPSAGNPTTGNHLFINAHSGNHQLPQLHHKVLSGCDPRSCVTACRKGPCTITMTEKRHQEI